MRFANWFLAGAVATSAGLLGQSSIAQLKKGAAAPDDVPRGKALGVATDEEVPRGKSLGAANRALAEERREARRLPVIDAGATFRASQLIGLAITDADGRNIGKVVDFISDNRGNILFPVISYTGSPGFSGKLFAIPSTGLTFQAGSGTEMTAQLTFEPQLLRNAPSFTSTRFPDFSDQTFLKELSAFYAKILPGTTIDRRTALDPTVPANGPGDRVQTQDQAGTPRLPTDPSLPANGPGDRPTLVNPALPRTGTAPPGSVIGRTGSPAGSTLPGGTTVEGEAAPTTTGSTPNSRMMLRSSQMLGMTIQGKDGASIGKVIDFVGDTQGNNQFAVVSLTGDERMIVVPFRALHFQGGARGSSFATLRIAPGQLKNAPSFTGNQWPDFNSPKFGREFFEFYDPNFPVDFNDPNFMHLETGKRPSTGTAPGSAAPSSAPTPRASQPVPGTAPRPETGPRLPAPGSGAPGVPGIPKLPSVQPGAPGTAPGGAPGTAPGGAPAPGGPSGPGAGESGRK